MKLYPYLVVILLLASNTSAECRDIECMPDEYRAEFHSGSDWIFYYDSIFTIGSNWYIIFERDGGVQNPETITFSFVDGPNKKITGFDEAPKQDNSSISFSGSSFTKESFHNVFYINFTSTGDQGQEVLWSYELEIQINEDPSPANDLVYLWGGMSVFWLSIGLYVLYISNKFRELSDKIGVEDNGIRKKN